MITGCSLAWFKVLVLETRDREFKSLHPDHFDLIIAIFVINKILMRGDWSSPRADSLSADKGANPFPATLNFYMR